MLLVGIVPLLAGLDIGDIARAATISRQLAVNFWLYASSLPATGLLFTMYSVVMPRHLLSGFWQLMYAKRRSLR